MGDSPASVVEKRIKRMSKRSYKKEETKSEGNKTELQAQLKLVRKSTKVLDVFQRELIILKQNLQQFMNRIKDSGGDGQKLREQCGMFESNNENLGKMFEFLQQMKAVLLELMEHETSAEDENLITEKLNDVESAQIVMHKEFDTINRELKNVIKQLEMSMEKEKNEPVKDNEGMNEAPVEVLVDKAD